MIFKTKKINIKKNILKKKKFNKNEIKRIILKSLIQNKNIKPIIRSYILYKNSRKKCIYSISKQKNNLCLYSGKLKSVYKKYNMSRHLIKKLSYTNELKNSKLINW